MRLVPHLESFSTARKTQVIVGFEKIRRKGIATLVVDCRLLLVSKILPQILKHFDIFLVNSDKQGPRFLPNLVVTVFDLQSSLTNGRCHYIEL